MDPRQVWCIMYCGIVSFQFHPGCKAPLPMVECAMAADLAMVEYFRRWKE